jgi:hypothetical protein
MVSGKTPQKEGGKRLLNLKSTAEKTVRYKETTEKIRSSKKEIFWYNKSSCLWRYTPREIVFEHEEQIKNQNKKPST